MIKSDARNQNASKQSQHEEMLVHVRCVTFLPGGRHGNRSRATHDVDDVERTGGLVCDDDCTVCRLALNLRMRDTHMYSARSTRHTGSCGRTLFRCEERACVGKESKECTQT